LQAVERKPRTRVRAVEQTHSLLALGFALLTLVVILVLIVPR